MIKKLFRSNSCINFVEPFAVQKSEKSDTSLHGVSKYITYDDNKYTFLNVDKDVLEHHPRILIAFDKFLKKKVVIKKCRLIKNELNSLFKFDKCEFIEKIIQYDFLQKIVIYDYNENKDLSEYMKKYPITLEQSTNVVLNPILQALDFIHKKGYAHRDVKPENILYYDDGCKLIDFEFCELLPESGHYSNLRGTIDFMAPEVTCGKCCLESDIWSLGIVYYECIHNTLPFLYQYSDSTYYKLFQEIRTKDIMINLNLDLSIITIFKIMLSKDIDVRKKCYHKIYALIKSIDWNEKK